MYNFFMKTHPCLSPFKGFSQKGLVFLRELQENNTKEWFEVHKHLYTQHILEPNRAFVVEMGEHLQALVPTINALPKVNGSLYRIYRDTRFARDKAPLKTHTGVIFWQGSAKRTQSASFYLRATPQEYVIGAGIREFGKELLNTYREYIKDEKKAESLQKILDACRQKGYKIAEPSFKRLPKGFEKSYPYPELALMRGIFANKKFTPDRVFFSEAIVDRCFGIYEELLALHQWLYEMTLQLKTV